MTILAPETLREHWREAARRAGLDVRWLPALADNLDVLLEAEDAQTGLLVLAGAAEGAALLARGDLPAWVSLLIETNVDEAGTWLARAPVVDVMTENAGTEMRTIALKRAEAAAQTRCEHARLCAADEVRARHLADLNRIGAALSTEHNLDRLLELIVAKARELTRSDAGSLYLVERDRDGELRGTLMFQVAQNDSLEIDFSAFRMPIDRHSIAGHVALTGEILQLDDVYELPPEAEYGFNRAFDQKTGYRSQSMLVVPMQNTRGRVIGVLQLINKKRRASLRLRGVETEDEVVSFDDADRDLVSSLAGQAAVSIENAELYEAIQRQFETFIRASVWAVEQRDPATAGHSERVTTMTLALARAVSVSRQSRFRDIHYDDEALRELYYAGMLHDFGKINVREEVFVKAKKLYPYQLERIADRFTIVRLLLRAQRAEAAVQAGGTLPDEFEHRLQELDAAWRRIRDANEPSVLATEAQDDLNAIRQRVYHDPDLGEIRLLTDEEYHNLSIPRGSLNDREREEIQSHVVHSYRFLRQIPWTEDLDNVAEIARGHHEMLNGTGYPRGVTAEEIPLETRMMTICDIFDALTASDRPYKKAMSVERALEILQMEVDDGRLDADLFALFKSAEVYRHVPAGQEAAA